MHFYFGVVDRVFLAACRNYSPDITRYSIAGQISTIYYDTGVTFRLDDGLRVKCPF